MTHRDPYSGQQIAFTLHSISTGRWTPLVAEDKAELWWIPVIWRSCNWRSCNWAGCWNAGSGYQKEKCDVRREDENLLRIGA